jgi:hypothetical protein
MINLPNSMSSEQDLRSAILEIQNYAKWFSQNSIKTRYADSKKIEPPALTPGVSQLIDLYGGEKDLTKEKIDELVKQLKQLNETLPKVTITLAAPASSSIKQNIVEWCRKNISQNVLVNFKFNANILGGMVIVYNSHIYDWSFRRQILANRYRFAEVLKNV